MIWPEAIVPLVRKVTAVMIVTFFWWTSDGLRDRKHFPRFCTVIETLVEFGRTRN